MGAVKTILYFQDSGTYQDRQKQIGVASHASSHGWNMQTAAPARTSSETHRLLQLWNPDGVIVNDASARNRDAIRACLGRPMVLFSSLAAKTGDRAVNIHTDCDRIADVAIRELLSIRSESFAYVNHAEPDVSWNIQRRERFRDILDSQGRALAEFQPLANASARSLSVMAKWLAGLPKPASVFAANDKVAVQVIAACRLAALSVPDDIAVIGVDNDPDLCESSQPTLSSIGFDYCAAGRLAAETLDRLMSHPKKRIAPVLYSPSGVVPRASTRRLTYANAAVRNTLELIRQKACEGLGAKEALAAIPGSRRMAEIRFRELVGHSALEEIRAVRLAEAKRLLAVPSLSVDDVAHRAGYSTLAAFTTFFKSMTGSTPSHWRKTRPSLVP